MKTKRLATTLAAVCALSASATPAIEDYSVEQIWGEKVLKVSFTLTERAILTVDILTNGVSIGAENYSTMRDPLEAGNEFPANKIVDAGDHVWLWRPTIEWPGRKLASEHFQVELKAWSFDDPPDYMIVTYNVKSNAYFYARAEDIPGGIKTADPNDADAVAALANDPYRTTKIVLRKIPAKGVKWRMGSPSTESYRLVNEIPHYVMLTNDYYVSIYPITFTQGKNFLGFADNAGVNPKHNTKYTVLRGSYDTAGSCWPDDGYAVTAGSKMGIMRKLFGLRFDLLTEAEWEYACRAGTEGRWNHDGTTPDAVAWTSYTGKAKGNTVGLKLPNRWGLYDMHGLVQEWVLDQHGTYVTNSIITEAVIAPVGATNNVATRVLRGGPKGYKWSNSVGYNKSPQITTRSAYRASDSGEKEYDGNNNGYGIRISCPAVLPDWMR